MHEVHIPALSLNMVAAAADFGESKEAIVDCNGHRCLSPILLNTHDVVPSPFLHF